MRGKVRKFVYKQYRQIDTYTDTARDLALIHSSKLSLFVLFFVSVTTGATVINTILFSLFLILTTISYHNVQRFWRLTIIATATIITTLYAIQIIKPNLNQLQQQILQVIGLYYEDQPKLSPFAIFGIYTPYMCLLFVLVITYHIIFSDKYEAFLNEFQNLELSLNSVSDIKTDPLTHFIIRYSLYITIGALFVECILMPINVLNLVLITLLAIIIIQDLKCQTLNELYTKLDKTLLILKWTSTLFIFMKYVFQFTSFFTPKAIETLVATNQQDLITLYNNLPFFERLLGMDNSYVPVKLFSLALVMSLSSFQTKFLKYTYLKRLIELEDSGYPDQIPTSRWQEWGLKLKKLTIYMMSSSLKLVLPILLLIYALSHPSLLSFCLILSLMKVIATQEWSKSYFDIGIASILALILIYSA